VGNFKARAVAGESGSVSLMEYKAGVTQATEAAGGKLSAIYMTVGPYDYIAVVEGLSDEAALPVSSPITSFRHRLAMPLPRPPAYPFE
jgi:hypothetical protein